MPAARFVVKGRVQGVGYRYFVLRHAEQLGLAGYARNQADGSVEVVVQGKAQAVDEVVRFCRVGPDGARVDHVKVDEHPASDPASDPEGSFEIRH